MATRFTFTQANGDITLANSIYSTPGAVMVNSEISVRAKLASSGTAYLQQSDDNTNWFDVPDSTITANTEALQDFVECKAGNYVRVVSATQIVSVTVTI